MYIDYTKYPFEECTIRLLAEIRAIKLDNQISTKTQINGKSLK
jgi:hypothetical protein